MSEKLKPDDKVLLMREEGEGNNLKVVKGINKRGKIDTVDPMKANENDFLKVDPHSDILTNFLKNFINQSKNPSHTGFYAVSVSMLDKILMIDDKELEKYRINPQEYLKQQEQTNENKQTSEQNNENSKEQAMETTKEEKKQEFKQMDVNKIPDSEFEKFGIKREDLEGELKAMSYGFKSPHLVDIKPKVGDEEFPMKARLSLEEHSDGIRFKAFPRQETVDMDKPFMGIKLPDDVKENLLATGNGGRVVELEPNPGEKVPALLSIDKLTNRIEAVPVDKINIRENLKGVDLSPEQQQALKEGKKVLVEGMTSKNTIGTDNPKKFDAHVQYNAAKGQYDFTYDGIDNKRYKQDATQSQTQGEDKTVRIPKKLLGVELTEQQQKDLREDKTIYVKGMVTDKSGEPFNAYVKVNTEAGKLNFYKWNPDKAKKQGAEVKPANESKTQVAVNNDGKTNEATKNVKEPLKQGQQKPTATQDKQQKADVSKKKVNKVKM